MRHCRESTELRTRGGERRKNEEGRDERDGKRMKRKREEALSRSLIDLRLN